MADHTATRIGEGVYRIEVDGRSQIVYVAGPPTDRWVFWNGKVYRGDFRQSAIAGRQDAGASAGQSSGPRRHGARGIAGHALLAPMPATIVKVLVAPGRAVKKGETIMVLEAMKMELPIRAPADATVRAVCCREGELVQADAVLVEFE